MVNPIILLSLLFQGFLAPAQSTGSWMAAECDTQFVDPLYNPAVTQNFSGEFQPYLSGFNRDGEVDRWPAPLKNQLTYCVSDNFGQQKSKVSQAFQAAAKDWMEAANVTFKEVSPSSCELGNDDLVFAIIHVGRRVRFSMRSFFPSSAEQDRKVQVRDSSSKKDLTYLTNVFRHEIGHILGFRHEQVHPDSKIDSESCPKEDGSPAIPITKYDRGSVMHYLRCGGTNGYYTHLSDWDRIGAEMIYPFESN